METEFQAGDIIVAVLAILGVVFLIILFVLVFRNAFITKD